MKTHVFTPKFVRRIPDPVFPGAERHILMCAVQSVPVGRPKDPNPREQRVARAIWKDIKRHLLNKEGSPNTFHLKNKGITIIASKVRKRDDNEIDVGFAPGDGIVDGGHTYQLLVENLDELRAQQDALGSVNQFVKFEILTGVERPLATEIAGGLNTAIQVQRASLENLRGRFEWIKQELAGTGFSESIAFRENDPGQHDIREIISWLACFNIFAYPNDGDEHPVRAYMSKASVLDAFCENADQYERLKPVLKDILVFHDIISQEARALHNERGGKAANLAFVEKRSSGKYKFVFSGKEDKCRLSRAALLPMLAAFRWMLTVDEHGAARWKGSFDEVLELWRRVGGDLMKATQRTSEGENRRTHAIGRNANHWETIHSIVIKKQLMASL